MFTKYTKEKKNAIKMIQPFNHVIQTDWFKSVFNTCSTQVQVFICTCIEIKV